MYLPAVFAETDASVLHALVRAHPFATWFSVADGAPVADHVPFLIDADRGPHGTLVGHVARANPVWRTAADGQTSLVVFQGVDAYITPSWYASKRMHGKVVPTWNYAVVHAHGRAEAIEDRERLLAIVTRLTDTHEADRADRWQVTDAPADFVRTMLDAIVGIEIPIERIVGKWKVSQNRPAADRDGVADGLVGERGDDAGRAMAALVRPAEPTR